MARSLAVLAALAAALAVVAPGAAGPEGRAGREREDAYEITLESSLADAPVSGRLILFFVTEPEGRWARVAPLAAPFYSRPQPIVSVAVENLAPGAAVTVDGATAGFPGRLDEISGPVHVQALLDVDDTERGHEAGPGNLYSEVVPVDLSPVRADRVSLTLTRRIEVPETPPDRVNLKWIRLRSERLSAFYGREILHRAGVALPRGYVEEDRNEDAAQRRPWPVILVIPGFGGRDDLANDYALMHATRGTEDLAPQAVHVVLDPESPLGHHGFVDSPNHGPRGTALVEELLPHLRSRFRLVEGPDGWIVTGHSSGGWTSLWLQLRWPQVFGACWSSAPDPIDFSAFQMTDLYHDESVYVDGAGRPTPSYREQIGPEREVVRMTVRAEGLMEHALHPDGTSGQQWDAWEAMFSPRDPTTGLPRPLFDALTGRIDREVVAHWRRFDITRLVDEDWARSGPIVTGRVRLMCGTLDSYYLNRAVERFKAMVERHAGLDAGPGYVEFYVGATHDNLLDYIFDRWNKEMRAYLEEGTKGQRDEGTKGGGGS